MPFSCSFSNGFSNGFEICDGEPPTPETGTVVTLVGTPSLKPHKRPQVAEISGTGLVPVIGAGRLEGEAVLSGNLLQVVTGESLLVGEALRVLIGAIRSGAEAVLTVEVAAVATVVVALMGIGRGTLEGAMAGTGSSDYLLIANATRQRSMQGLGAIQAGGAGAIVGVENEEAIIIAAAMYLTRLLD